MSKVVKNKKRIGYEIGRVSTVEQGRTQHGSLEQQGNAIRRLLDRAEEETGYKYQIIKSFKEKRSGKRESFHLRKGIPETIDAIKNNLIDFVAIENVERMGRWALKNLELVEIAHDYGVEVWFVKGGLYNHNDSGHRLKFHIDNMFAEEDVHKNRERVTQKQREAMVNNGKDVATVPPLGLDAHANLVGVYVPNQAELKVVVDIYKKFCELKSFKLLNEYCSSKKYRTKQRTTKEATDLDGNRIHPKKVGGEPFNEKSLRALLTSSKLRGYNQFVDDYDQFPKLQDNNKVVRWEYAHHRGHGPLISPTLIESVDKTLDLFQIHRPKLGKYKVIDLLKGILRDSDGNTFHAKSAKSGSYRYYYNSPKNGQVRYSIPANDLEARIIARVKEYLQRSGTLEKIAKATLSNRLVGLPLIEEQIPSVQSEIRRLEKIIAGFDDKLNEIALASTTLDLVKVISTLNAGKERAEGELASKRAELDALLGKKHHIQHNLRHKTLEDFLNLNQKIGFH